MHFGGLKSAIFRTRELQGAISPVTSYLPPHSSHNIPSMTVDHSHHAITVPTAYRWITAAVKAHELSGRSQIIRLAACHAGTICFCASVCPALSQESPEIIISGDYGIFALDMKYRHIRRSVNSISKQIVPTESAGPFGP
jgi:hypothetical protein